MFLLIVFCLFAQSVVHAAQAAQLPHISTILMHYTRSIEPGSAGSGFFRTPTGYLTYVQIVSKDDFNTVSFESNEKKNIKGKLVGVDQNGFVYCDARQNFFSSDGITTHNYGRLKGLKSLKPSPLLSQMVVALNEDINQAKSTYRMRIVDTSGMNIAIPLDIQNDPANSSLPVTISNDGTTAFVTRAQDVRGGRQMAVVNMTNGKVRANISASGDAPNRVSISPDNHYAACIAGNQLSIFNLTNGNLTQVVQPDATGSMGIFRQVDSCVWVTPDNFFWFSGPYIGSATLSGNRFESSRRVWDVRRFLASTKYGTFKPENVLMRGILSGDDSVLFFLRAKNDLNKLYQGVALINPSTVYIAVQVFPGDERNVVELLPGYVIWNKPGGDCEIYAAVINDDETVDPALAEAAATPLPAPDASGL